MPNLSDRFGRLVDKMKKHANNKIDRLGHNTKFDTSTFKKSDKNSYWKNNKKPKKQKTNSESILSLVLSMIVGLIIISIVLFFNANFMFLIKEAGQGFYNKAFPSACDEPPFGTKTHNPCTGENKMSLAAIKALEASLAGGGGGPTSTASCKKPGSGFPYSFFNKSPSGVTEEYSNWFLTSLANTDMNLNSYIKDVLENKRLKSIPNGIMILAGSLLLTLLPIVGIFTFYSLLIGQFKSLFSQSFGTILLICFTCLIVVGANSMISTFNIMNTWYKLVIYPAIADNWKNWPQIQAIASNEKIMIGYFIGLIFVIALLSTPLNKHYSAPVKGVTASVFSLIVIVHLFSYLHNLWKSDSKSCKL